MILSNIAMTTHLRELMPLLEQAFVSNIQDISSNLFKFKLSTSQGNKDFIVSEQGFFLSNYKMDAQTTKTKTAFISKQLENKKILKINQYNFDRILEFEFHDHSLIFEFISNLNLILLDKNKKILFCLNHETWKDREIKKGLEYIFPANQKLNPCSMNYLDFSKTLHEKPIALSLINVINLPPNLIEDILIELEIDKKVISNSLSEKKAKELFSLIQNIALFKTKLFPCLLETKKGKIISLSLKNSNLDSINSLLNEFIAKPFLTQKSSSFSNANNKIIDNLNSSLALQITARSSLAERISLNKKKAEFLYLHQIELAELVDAINVGLKKGLTEASIISTIKKAGSKNNLVSLIKELKSRKLVIEVKE